MNGERVFRALGQIDPDLIDEAAAPVRRKAMPWKPLLAGAACAALIAAVGLHLPHSWSSGAALGGSGIRHEESPQENEPLSAEGTTFMSYAGPVFPLTVPEDTSGLTAERTVTWGFAPQKKQDGSRHQWGAEVTDRYLLSNPTGSDRTVTAVYPFAASLDRLHISMAYQEMATITVNGTPADAALYAGAYAGGFQGTLGPDGPDSTTFNLEAPDSWTDYKALLDDGGYLRHALEDLPPIRQTVTVYEFSGFTAPFDKYPAATQGISFTIDPEATQILTYGFNGSAWDTETGWRMYDFFVPNGVRRDPQPKLLIVLGEDFSDYTLQGYQNGGCEQGLDGVRCQVTRTVTTMDEVLMRVCLACREDYLRDLPADQQSCLNALSPELLYRCTAELLLQYGVLSDRPMDRYADGRLDDLVGEAMTQRRVLYLAFPVTIPAGETVDVTAEMWKAPSFDYGCSDSENVGLQGYDLVTQLGSSLLFTQQTAALADTDTIKVVRQNFGFDPEHGITEVLLDPSQEHYYLEIRAKQDAN